MGGGENLARRKSTRGRTFLVGGDEQIFGWWGTPPTRENLVIPYIKAKKKRKTSFIILKF